MIRIKNMLCYLQSIGILLVLILLSACNATQPVVVHDIVIRGGLVYDGSGGPAIAADVAIDDDRISALGDLADRRGRVEIDATGLAIAPGFINMLSWANTSLIQDGRSMSEENIKNKIAPPWVSICSDSASVAPEAPFTNSQPHPRAYGSFARLLGKYVREEKVISLEEAIHRLSGLPAANLKLEGRGLLVTGNYADVVVFDPELITDQATFEKPHQLATGVLHVFVNGEQVLRDGEHTGTTPGRFVKGPGWVGNSLHD